MNEKNNIKKLKENENEYINKNEKEKERIKILILDIKKNKLFKKKKVNLNILNYKIGVLNNKKNDFLSSYPLLTYSLKRIFYAIITLYIAIAVLYALLNIVASDSIYIGDIDLNKNNIIYGSEQYYNLIENRKKLLGVDGSLLSQIIIYLRNITPFIPKEILTDAHYESDGSITGTMVTKLFYLGITFTDSGGFAKGTFVQTILSNNMPVSFQLGAIATVISFFIGIPIGIYAAINKENVKDNFITWFCLIMFALPALVIVRLFFQFSIYYLGAGSLWTDSTLYTKIFPVLLLVLLGTPAIIFETRRYIVNEMSADYTKFALSKGMTNRYVFFVHIFRIAGIAIIRSIPAALIANLFGASLLVEQSWSVLGMANTTVSAISQTDLFLILGIVLVSASISLLLSLISDLLMALLDPRVKLMEKKKG
ncbi:oligopeptide ABC transporter permease OppB [Spiroplasma taiwanense]|uniref:Oligopeptide ABC transporter permease n=1 Tax=Spiroplasma taiwanense CT-1 TaxID=1276220 RepID=S5LUJ5_9MOLU|nr:oligopeptide ABC transporter permease OppB [Spiroplasma taiwanense]AGR41469.1 oligopeptide ABC transporter permease [Spiroplasma taiwanense CT-1]